MKCDICNDYHFSHDFISTQSITYLSYEYHLTEEGLITIAGNCLSKYIAKNKIAAQVVISCNSCGKYTNKISKCGKYCTSCEEKFKPCIYCKEISPHHHKTVKGLICDNCYQQRQMTSCKMCGIKEDIKISHEHRVGPHLCEKCSKKYVSCDKCGKAVGNDQAKKLGDFTVCSSCAKYAGDLTCNICGVTTMTTYEVDGELCCRSCAAEKDVAVIGHWSHTPHTFYRNGRDREGIYFGFENEVFIKDPDKVQPTLVKIIKNYSEKELYCVQDGSIGGIPYGNEGHGKYGFELVSHIFSMTALKEMEWSHMFTKDTIKHKTTGMHIHISKIPFTTFHLYKFMKFIYKNKAFTNKIGERKTNPYAKHFDGSIKSEAKKKWRKKTNQARRVKVNLCNKMTVELRFFASVTTVAGLMKNLEFTHALFYFTRDNSRSAALSVIKFKRFIKKNKEEYPNLVAFLRD